MIGIKKKKKTQKLILVHLGTDFNLLLLITFRPRKTDGSDKPKLVYLLKDNIFHQSKFKIFADNNKNVALMIEFVSKGLGNISGNGKKCWLPAYSPFPTLVFKSQLC